MTVKEFADNINAEIISGGDNLHKEISGCYIGDLLSWVMANAEEGNVWMTIMSNINVVAVAKLTEVSCILMCEHVTPDSECLKRSNEQGITILRTSLSAYDAAVALSKIL